MPGPKFRSGAAHLLLRYFSTRGAAPALVVDDALLAGLARDGGLYVPESWPQFSAADIRALSGLDYVELAVRVMAPFLGGRIAEADFAALVEDAYAGFNHAAVVPLRSEEHTSELQSLMRISYAVFCLKKKKHTQKLLRNQHVSDI